MVDYAMGGCTGRAFCEQNRSLFLSSFFFSFLFSQVYAAVLIRCFRAFFFFLLYLPGVCETVSLSGQCVFVCNDI